MSLIERLSLLHRLTLCMAESRTHNLHVPFLAYPVDTPIYGPTNSLSGFFAYPLEVVSHCRVL